MTTHLYELALTIPWCCTTEALDAILAIAAREPMNEEEIKQRFHGPKSLALRDGTRRDDSERMSMRDGVALIPIDGPIYRYADMFTAMSGGITTDAIGKDFQRAVDDPQVRAILFVIDSPGGEATSINELADTIYAARDRKPIGAYAEGYCASAAYWIASAAGEIVADDNALIGSIGTVMGMADPSKRPSQRIDFVSKQSPKKRVDPTSETGRAYFQAMVDDMTEVFIGRVMRNRDMTYAQILAVEGGMKVGQQAVDAGLVDRLGSEEQAIHDLLAKAGARYTSRAAFSARAHAKQWFKQGVTK
jgi:signal peptide peptidase SppA